MSKVLKSAPFWSALLALIYLIFKYWIGFNIPGWNDISAQIVTIITIVLGN